MFYNVFFTNHIHIYDVTHVQNQVVISYQLALAKDISISDKESARKPGNSKKI